VDLTDPTGMHPFHAGSRRRIPVRLVVISGSGFGGLTNGSCRKPAPIADVGQIAAPLSSQVALDGGGSYDPDNIDELLYKWTQLEGLKSP
jgi:hypothetical protein